MKHELLKDFVAVLFCLIMVCIGLNVHACDLVIGGTTEYSIVVAQNASNVEQKAASEL